MQIKDENLLQICRNALLEARKVLECLSGEGTSEIDHDKDIVTKGDMAVSERLVKYFREQGLPAVLLSEESGKIELAKNPSLTIVFDDIDGTDNYSRGRGLLPYCTAITIFDTHKPLFENAVAAGIIEHNSGNLWLAQKGKGCYLNDNKVSTSGKKKLDKRTLVIIDHYGCADRISKLLDIYPEAWVKDFGTAAFHLAGVSSGLFDAYVHLNQKQHELGAGFLMIKEGGGFLSNINREPLDCMPYDFNAKLPIVAAASQELGETILSRIR